MTPRDSTIIRWGIIRMQQAARKLLVVTEWPLREGFERDIVERSLLREGINVTATAWYRLADRPYAGDVSKATDQARRMGAESLLRNVSEAGACVILALGDSVTELLTGERGIDKWQASVLRRDSRTIIPCYSADRVAADLSLQVWVALCCRKAAAELTSPTKEPKYDFLLNPPLEMALAFLRRAHDADAISVDIETGRGQINTFGVAISPTEAIAINVLPDRLGAPAYHELWNAIRSLVESDNQPKILQNFIYETLFLSRYGISLRGVTHDTMICQKFLWPEFEMGLDAVGRMYTDMPYWKDDGKSWNNIRDWERHYEYNCKDTVGTFKGYQGQTADLKQRGLDTLHNEYIRRLFPAAAEMCSWGFPVSQSALAALKKEVSTEADALLVSLRREAGAGGLNPRSPTQVKNFLKGKGYRIPTKKGKESTDEKSLKKLRLKYPADESLSTLLRLAKLNKAHSSYLSFVPWADGRMKYQLIAAGTETMRMTGYCDPWDGGFNPQTAPGGNKGINIKSVFCASEGHTLLQVDLRQAESRFVAYDSADLNLIRTLEDPARDIHKEVAAEIYGIPLKEVTKQQRQLGKKSGHGANYSMKEATFQDSCIQEMDLVLSHTEANNTLEAYHRLFPGIRQWHARIRKELAQTRSLRTPSGWERYFYGRLDDDMFRQAYAFRPQSTIPWIVNLLMLHLMQRRTEGQFSFRLLLQCHDSLLLEVPLGPDVKLISAASHRLDDWHPEVTLAGGRLRIPVSIETGQSWGNLEEQD